MFRKFVQRRLYMDSFHLYVDKMIIVIDIIYYFQISNKIEYSKVWLKRNIMVIFYS